MNYCSINLNQIHEDYHPRKDFTGQEELKGSIEKEGLAKQPITVRKDGEKYVVIDGLRRLRAVKELGFKEIDCIIEEVDQKTAAHLSYRMNSNDLRKNLNPIEVSLHIKEMRETFGYKIKDLIKLGYGKDPKTIYNKLNLLTLPEKIQNHIAEGTLKPTAGYHLTKLNSEKQQIQIAEETTAKGEISTGKVGKKVNAILSAEKRQKQDMKLIPEIPHGEILGVFIKDASDMSEIKDESVGLIVTSPGYFVGMEYEENMTFEEHLENLHKVFSECTRVLKPGGRICINFADIHTFGTRNGGKPEMKLMGHEYQKILGEYGIRLIDEIIWRKGLNWINNPQCSYHDKSKHAEWRMLRNTEKIYIFRKDGDREVPFDLEYNSKISQDEHKEWVDSVWNIEPVTKQEGHPAQFPEEIPRRLIKMFSYKEDVVLDPFGGSMTTVKVANELGRVGIGFERDKKYKSAIMEKLGLKEEDLKKPDTNAVQRKDKKNESDFVDRFGKSVTEILANESRSEKDIRSIQVPYKSDFSKDEIVIDWVPDPEEPDPSGSPNLPMVAKTDDYEEKKHYPLITLPERKLDTAPYINTVIQGDCMEKLKPIPDNSVGLLVTDTPYGIKFMGKDWDKTMPGVDIWKEVLRVLKPGAFAFVMSAPRQDVLSRMITRLEDAGFITNFTPLYWTYARGLPKSHKISLAIDKKECREQVKGKLGRKPTKEEFKKAWKEFRKDENPETEQAKHFDGSYGGFQPKPAVEVIIVAMKPMSEKTYIGQALNNGKGITWLDDCRIPYKSDREKWKQKTGIRWSPERCWNSDCRRSSHDAGRFPANLLVSDDALGEHSRFFSLDTWAEKIPADITHNLPFLMVKKASTKEKTCDGKIPNSHETVKPIKLMSCLITMGSREGDVVLDPFCGSATTCVAAKMLNRKFIGIELSEEYHKIATQRVETAALEKVA